MQAHVFRPADGVFHGNSLILEGAHAVVLVDAQPGPPEARALRARIAALGKPLVAMLLTWPQADPDDALAILDPLRQAALLTTPSVAEARRRIAAGLPGASPRRPDRLLAPGRPFHLAGIAFAFLDVAGADVLHLPDLDAMVVHGLVRRACHPWLAEGGAAAWLERLALLRTARRMPRLLFPGRGAPGGPELLDRQHRDIATFRDMVTRAARGRSVLPAAETGRLVRATIGRFPGYALEELVPLNVAGVATETAGQRPTFEGSESTRRRNFPGAILTA